MAATFGGMAQAAPAPCIPDSNTLFLFHFDESYGGSVTTNVGSLVGRAYSVDEATADTSPPNVTDVFGFTSYSGFGNASWCGSGELIGFDYNNNGFYDGDGGSSSQLSADSFPMSVLNMGNGGQTPWTIEALIQPSVTNANQEIICTDSSTTAARAFQFRINTSGQLELNLITLGVDIKTAIPTDSANGFVADNWYHVAATYDGANLVLYWTKVTPSSVAANPISTNAVAVGVSFGSVTGSLGVGNRTRSPAIEYFQGLIDEVRISNIARAANQMIISSGTPGSVTVSPTVITPTNPVYRGSQVTLSATASGTQPINHVWQSDGGSSGISWTNLLNSTTNTYALNTTTMSPGNYQYRLIVSNAVSLATNAPATLNLVASSGPMLVADTTISPTRVLAGGLALISASYSGSQPLSYQWYFTNNNVVTLIAGATNTTYIISRVQSIHGGGYFLIASNNPPGLGIRTLSSTPALLTVLPVYSLNSGMFCNLLEHPEQAVISTITPKFGWFYQPSFRNDYQAGYRIIVASTLTLANAVIGDMWDSGLVSNSNSINVPYGGTQLQSGTSYFWRVQTVNSLGRTNNFSEIQQFNTDNQQLSNPLTTAGVVYKRPSANSVNCYPLRYVPVAPVLVTANNLGHWFIDFGKDAFGYATLHLNGNFSDTTIGFGLGELAGGNVVNTSPGGTIRYRSGSYSLQNGDNIYTNRSSTAVGTISPPSGTYGVVSPFRYLELSGIPTGVILTTNDVTQWRLQSEFDPTAATFASSSTNLNRVWNLCHYSMEALTFDGIYVDGDRERTPYEADSYIHQMSSYGAVNEFTMPRCSFEYLTNHLTWPTEWPMHMIFMAWADYQQTGDPYLMTKYYSFLTNKCMLYGNARANGLVWSYPVTGNTASGDIIDWYRNSGDGIGNVDGYVAKGTNAVINAFYYRCLTIMANVAQLTSHAADASAFAAKAGLVYSNYNSAFWNNNSQSYIDGLGTTHSSAAANFFPLVFGLVPASNQLAVVNYIHSRIAALGAMPAGVYGAQYLLEGMFLAGDSDTALGLMTANGTRSWMNMINIGSTLTGEAWSTTDKPNEDWNHAWGAAPGNLIPRYVLGLRSLAAGYGQILIQPHLGTSLSFAQGTIPTIRGPVSIMASNAPGQSQLLANIPGNVTVMVVLPATNTTAILDGAVIGGALSTDSLSNSWLTVTNIGSGQHAVWTSSTSSPTITTLYNNWTSSWFGTNASNPAIAGQSADPDADGMSNYNEFIAGTNPTDASDIFHITSASYSPAGTLFNVTIVGEAGRHYALQHATVLNLASWITVDAQTASADNQTIVLHDSIPPGSQQMFLRVAVSFP